jgi:hypothetical protein
MAKLSNNEEIAIVSCASTIGLTATYISTMPIPETVKIPIVSVLGLVAFVIGTFWAKYTNATTQTQQTTQTTTQTTTQPAK